MKDVNRLCITGNVGKDPEKSYTPGGALMVKFPLATTYRTKQGEEYVEETSWLTFTAWNKLAETIDKLVSKGARLYIEAEVRNTKYEKNGETKYVTNYTITDFSVFKYGKKDEDAGGGDQGSNAESDEYLPF